MKRFIIAALALSMAAIPAMQANAAPMAKPRAANAQSADVAQVDYRRDRRDQRRGVERRYWNDKMERDGRWKRGSRYSSWKRHQSVRDWQRRGLRRPGRGHEWIRVGNDYLLVGIASGIIASIVVGR